MSATAFRGKDFSALDETDDHTSASASLTDEDSGLPPDLTEKVINVGGWIGWMDGYVGTRQDVLNLRSKGTFSQTTAFPYYLNKARVRRHWWQLP